MRGAKSLAAVTTLALAGGMVLAAGCSPSTSNSSTGSSSASGSSSNSAPVDITWLRPNDGAPLPTNEDDPIMQAIDKKLNIKLHVQMVAQSDYSKITVQMASGNYPDLVTMNYPDASVNQWINDGILVPLNDYLDVMPTIKDVLTKETPWSAVDGKYYGYLFMTQHTVSNMSLTFRQDWMDKLKLKTPTTLDEFYNVLKTFRTQDPDGNGKEDTYGLSAYTGNSTARMSNMDWVFYAYGMPYADWSLDANGKVIPKFEDPAFKKGIQYLSKLYADKLLDPEFAVNNSTQLIETKFYQSKIGMYEAPLFRNYGRIQTSLKKVVPTASLGFMPAPKGPDGKHGYGGPGKGGLFTAVTKSSKNPKKAAELIEFLHSKEGFDLLTLGIEGQDYTKNGDKISFNLDKRKADGFADDGWAHWLTWGALTWPLESHYIPASDPDREMGLKSVDVASAEFVPNLVPLQSDSEVKNAKVLDGIYNEYFVKMVTGQGDLDASLKELSQKWRSQGGDQVLKEVQAMKDQQK